MNNNHRDDMQPEDDMRDDGQDEMLAGFETYDEPLVDDAQNDELINDADFQDVDADVFGEGEPEQAAPRKKTNWFNIGVAGAAVLLAGGLILTKLGPQILGGGDNAPVQVSDSVSANVNAGDSQAAVQQAVMPAGSANTASGTGLLDNPDQFANVGVNSGSVGTAETATSNGIADPFANVPNAPTQAAVSDVIQPTLASPDAASPATGVAPVPMPTPIATAPLAAPAADIPVAATPVATAPVLAAPPAEPSLAEAAPNFVPAAAKPADTAIPMAPASESIALASKVNSIESRLDTLDARLAQAMDKMQQPATPVDDARLNTIQTTLERLEARLDTMSSAPKPATTRNVSIDDGDDTPAPVKRSTSKKKSTTPAKKTKPAASSVKWDEPYREAAPMRTEVSLSTGGSNAGTGWELRGARPGRAVIARGNDIREVGVGDSVPGLGEVTGVASVNGGWVVQGTGGRVSQ